MLLKFEVLVYYDEDMPFSVSHLRNANQQSKELKKDVDNHHYRLGPPQISSQAVSSLEY